MLFNCGVGEESTLESGLETLESPLDCKEIQPVHPKGRTDAEAETPILWPPNVKG